MCLAVIPGEVKKSCYGSGLCKKEQRRTATMSGINEINNSKELTVLLQPAQVSPNK